MSIIQDILSGVAVYWENEKTKINANFAALNADKAETSTIPTATSDLTNDSDFVADASYVATDNNLTDAIAAAIVTNTAKRSYPAADETRLANTSGTNTGDQDLSSYATTAAMTSALTDKVDVDGAKILTDVNFSSADKVLVDTIEDKQTSQIGYGLSQNNYSDADLSKVGNLPINTITSLAAKADLVDDLIPLGQLPDSAQMAGVPQYDDLASFPTSGDSELLYLAKDTNILYRWDGSAYIVVASADTGVDISGTAEIADSLVDADLLLVNDVSASANKSSLVSRLWTYILAKIVSVTDVSTWGFVLDEDNLASDDDTKLATQQSIKAYVTNSTASLTWDGDITDIDIAGGTDITDDLADSDLFVIEDVSVTGNRKSSMSRVWQYIRTILASAASNATLNSVNLQDYGMVPFSPSIDTNTLGLNFADGHVFTVTLDSNVNTLSISVANDYSLFQSCLIFLTQDATGSRTVTWPASILWAGGSAPTLTGTANSTDVIKLMCIGVSAGESVTWTWYGKVEGADFS